MPIYYTTRDRAKTESKGHRFEQDYNVFCSSDQEHKPLWQFSYAHGLVVGIEELANPEDPDQETESFAILFDITTNRSSVGSTYRAGYLASAAMR